MPRHRSTPRRHLPKSKCEKIVAPKKNFHAKSFRWKVTPKASVMVGCPVKVTLVRGGRRVIATRYDAKRPIGKQCVDVKTKKPVGLRAHAVVVKSGGRGCRVGYKRVKSRH